MSRKILVTSQFKKDLKLVRRRGKNIDKLEAMVNELAEDIDLPTSLRDHNLKGKWGKFRECHLEPDWLLMYRKIDDDQLVLVRTGSHSDLFD